MTNIVSRVAKRLKLSERQTNKLRTTASIAGATSGQEILAVLAGIEKGECSAAEVNVALSKAVLYPQRVDECPICYANMQPITLVADREAYFCPVHNVVMPVI